MPFKVLGPVTKFHQTPAPWGRGQGEGCLKPGKSPSSRPSPLKGKGEKGSKIKFCCRFFILSAAALLGASGALALDATGTATPLAAPAAFMPTSTPAASLDGLSPMDHAPIWVQLETGYNYSLQGDLIHAAQALNGGNYVNPGGLGAYTGATTASNNGLELGFELGLLLDPHSGLALGARFIQNNEFLSSLTYLNGPSNPDSESVTLLPTVVPITLDYYYFIPDGGGRFFLTGGVGYYVANVRVGQYTTTDNLLGNNNTIGGPDIWEGNVSSAAFGFQAGLGREFALGKAFGIALFVRGRYARLSNFQGQLLDSNAVAGRFGLAENSQGVVDVDQVSNINGGERYATVDFTGFDAGLALIFFDF